MGERCSGESCVGTHLSLQKCNVYAVHITYEIYDCNGYVIRLDVHQFAQQNSAIDYRIEVVLHKIQQVV